MLKPIYTLTIILLLLYSCVSEEKQYFQDESEVVNEKIMYHLSKIEEKYLLNPRTAQPFFNSASFLKSGFDSLLYFSDQGNFKEVHNRFIDLYAYLEPNSYFNSEYIQEIVIPSHFNKWIGNEKKYSFSDKKEVLKLDILNLENELINYLYNSIEADYYKFNKLEAMVVDSSDNIRVGDTYHANIFFAAYDTTRHPSIMVADKSQPNSVLDLNIPDNKRLFQAEVWNGRGVYKKKVHKPGKHGFKGVIHILNSKGEIEKFMFYKEFTVKK